MKKSQNKHSFSNAKHSSHLHTTRLRSFYYPTTFARKLILVVILIAFIMVIISVVCSFFLNDETRTKTQISTITADYYENYFYTNLVNSEKFQQLEDKDAVMEKYNQQGLDTLTLGDLLFYDHRRNDKYYDYLSSQCDINATQIKIYPDPPYDTKSYHVEYIYDCGF